MLSLIDSLILSLRSREVRYCHWKSNENLDQTLKGETDLDILCHHDDRKDFYEILKNHGFTKLEEVVFTGYPGIENFVGYDPETGRCIHVHLHFELTIGTPFLKEYVTPWAPYVLERRLTDSNTDIPITNPEIELFLLVVRYSLKIRRFNVLSRKKYFNEFLEEYDWLTKRADESELKNISNDLLNPSIGEQILNLIIEGPSIRHLVKIGKSVRSELDTYATYQSWLTTPVALGRKGFCGVGKANREFLNRPYPSRRTIPSRGIEVAVIGIDGSGKSTHISSVYNWLSWKIDVHSVYFGSGDGPSSLLRYPLKKLNELRSPSDGEYHSDERVGQNKSKSYTEKNGQNKTNSTTKVGLAKAIWGILLAREKQKKRQRATRARNRGMIVVMDRYPQNQFEGINDGPLLQEWADSRLEFLAKIAAWEREIYADLEDNSPDIVIKLETDPEVAKKRKPETPMWKLQQKSKIIDSVEYKNTRVITIDTHQDIKDVLNEIKKEVWKEI